VPSISPYRCRMRFFLPRSLGHLIFQGPEHLKERALLAEQEPQALMADVVDHPSATRKSASLANDQVEKGTL
jgi:hypothetical protein